jgi:hypothetical protein
LGSKFFSHRTPGRTGGTGADLRAWESGLVGLDHQQARVLGALRRAAGAPVSYAELRAVGVELPASVVSELELAGVAIERCPGKGRGAVGVRLDPANDPAARARPAPDAPQVAMPTDTEDQSAWSGVRRYRASMLYPLFLGGLGRLSRAGDGMGNETERQRATERGRVPAVAPAPATRTTGVAVVGAKRSRIHPRSPVLAVTAVLVAVAAVSSVVGLWAAGGHRGPRVPTAKGSHPRAVVAAGGAAPASPARSTHATPPVPVSPALATQLEAQGHSLLEVGRYGDALPVLKRAVLATGETVGACLEPGSSTCLTYAYALYDLGRATRLSGDPQAAVSILERRLEIDNQRSTVGAQLQLARQGIG